MQVIFRSCLTLKGLAVLKYVILKNFFADRKVLRKNAQNLGTKKPLRFNFECVAVYLIYMAGFNTQLW